MSIEAPAWLREVHDTLGVSSHFVLEGNVRDNVLSVPPGGNEPRVYSSVATALEPWLRADGYTVILTIRPSSNGISLSCLPGEDRQASIDAATDFLRTVQIDPGAPSSPTILADGQNLGTEISISFEALAALIAAVAVTSTIADRPFRCALVCVEAARLVLEPQHLQPGEQSLFTGAQRAALGAEPVFVEDTRQIAIFNPVIWLVQSERDLPDWFLASGERVRTVAVPMPGGEERLRAAKLLAAGTSDYEAATEEKQAEMVQTFAAQAQGLSLQAMKAAVQIARDKGLGMGRIEDAVRAYRVGVVENPWRHDSLRDRISEQSGQIGEKVLGQEAAIQQSLDIIIRSITGMTAAHGSPNATKPRGVLFFAGPTGVGKTELAKQVTKLVFEDERAMVRFDMSEFSEEHNASRLIGAPPGYRGFDSGGELTNAMREKPFSLILFDEIEKAHGRILDKFLQILDDGRLTDGRGGTVYFTEALIVFTSNLGVTEVERDQFGQPTGRRKTLVTPGTEREEAERLIRTGIRDYFQNELGRPELLNRIGDNIVVFDFITEEVGQQILDLLISNVAARVKREHDVTIELSDQCREELGRVALSDLSQGGRGIGSRVERALVNPLARVLFEQAPVPGSTMRINQISADGGLHEIDF